MAQKPQILLAALGDWYGVCRLPELLHEAGAETTLLVLPRELARRTRFAKSVPTDGCYEVADLVAALRAHLAANPGKYAMVIPGDDMIMQALGAEVDKEWLRSCFPVEPTPAKLEMVLSTSALIDACARLGVPMPASVLCRDLEHAVEVAEQLGYPVFYKGEQSSGGHGVRRAANEAELRAAEQAIAPRFRQTFSVQKAINGPTGSTTVLAWRGEVIQFMCSCKAVTWGPYGVSTQRSFLRHPDALLMAERVARELGYSGFFGLDWIHCQETNRLVVVEMNPRPTPEMTVAWRDGIDFVGGLRHILTGSPKPALPSGAAQGGRYRIFPTELFRCYDENDRRGLLAWAWEVLRNGGDIPWRDRSMVVGMFKKLQRHRQTVRQARGASVAPRAENR